MLMSDREKRGRKEPHGIGKIHKDRSGNHMRLPAARKPVYGRRECRLRG